MAAPGIRTTGNQVLGEVFIDGIWRDETLGDPALDEEGIRRRFAGDGANLIPREGRGLRRKVGPVTACWVARNRIGIGERWIDLPTRIAVAEIGAQFADGVHGGPLEIGVDGIRAVARVHTCGGSEGCGKDPAAALAGDRAHPGMARGTAPRSIQRGVIASVGMHCGRDCRRLDERGWISGCDARSYPQESDGGAQIPGISSGSDPRVDPRCREGRQR